MCRRFERSKAEIAGIAKPTSEPMSDDGSPLALKPWAGAKDASL